MTTTTRTGFYGWGGYEWIEASERRGWRALSSWGADGWDLGDWPYVIISVRDFSADHRYELCEYCEGDLTIHTFSTLLARQQAIDTIAHGWWRRREELWYVEGDPRFNGPYRSRR